MPFKETSTRNDLCSLFSRLREQVSKIDRYRKRIPQSEDLKPSVKDNVVNVIFYDYHTEIHYLNIYKYVKNKNPTTILEMSQGLQYFLKNPKLTMTFIESRLLGYIMTL